MSERREASAVIAPNHIDVDALLREIARYLAAVDAFRAESREPTWLAERR
jgi:hypothetical protein